MADVNKKILKELWNTTEESTWGSLLSNLNDIHSTDVITTDQWEDLNYALKELSENETDFPDSVDELAVLLDPYM
ncbi:MAG TPA: hypothetical protein VI819_05420 [Patescibacteria group bacterium]|nr:hypothetical protein [Patescibacteria group bacterium]